MKNFPMSQIGEQEISRLIIGGNPFGGGSHFSNAKNRWLRRLLTDDAIVAMFEKCEEEGINTFLGRGDDQIFRVMNKFEEKHGRRFNWLVQTAPERGPHGGRHPMNRKPKASVNEVNTPTSIHEIAQHKPIGIYIQGSSVTDQLLNLEERKIEHVREWLELIRSYGILAGVGSHNHRTIDICEERGYNPDFYMITLNSLGLYCSGAPESISQSIKSTKKPVLAFKIMAAGRIPPDEAFKLALNCIKNTDFIVVGMAFPEEIEENAELVRKLTRSET
jgi:hypothetical protein